MNRIVRRAMYLLTAAATVVQAQVGGPLQVRTFILQNMTPEDAAALVAPYVDYTEGGGVFRAQAVRGVTVRAMPAIMARVDSLLKASDRPPVSVRLRFQVVAALDKPEPADPALGGLEGELRSVLRFAGYRQMAQGVLTTSDDRSSELSLSGGQADQFILRSTIQRVDPSDKGSVRLNLELLGWPWTTDAASYRRGTVILSTGMTIPFGQSIIVGSGSAKVFGESPNSVTNQALLLVVRADPVTGRP